MRRWWIVLLLLVALIGVAVWLNMATLASRGIRHELTKRNIPVQSLSVVRITPTQVELRDVALGAHGLVKAAKASIALQWNGNKLAAADVILQDADITAAVTEGIVTLDGIETLWGQAPATGGEPPVLLQAKGGLTLHYAIGGELSAQTTNASLTMTQDGQALVTPLAVTAELSGNLAQTLKFKGMAQSLEKAVQLSFDGTRTAQQTQVNWRSQPVRFAPDAFTFARLTPKYAGETPTIPMRLSAKGTFSSGGGSWKLTPTLTFHELPLNTLLASLLGEGAHIDGIVTGNLPLIIGPGTWRIAPSTLKNKGGLHVVFSPDAPGLAALKSHPQSEILLAALGNFQVETMSLESTSTDDHGGMHMVWHLLGANPDLYGGKKVDFTLAVNVNLEDIWMSATEAETLARKANGAIR